MDERSVNIDIVFRNGLKDLEVLPPPGVWDNVHPVVIRKQKPFILMRVAAIITILMAMSFLAYQWSMKISMNLGSPVIAFNEESVFPEYTTNTVSNEPIAIGGDDISLIRDNQNYILTNIPEQNENRTFDDYESSKISVSQTSSSLAVNNSDILNGEQKAILYSPGVNPFVIEEFNESDLPLDEVKDINRWTIAALASPTYNSSFNSGRDELAQQLMASEESLISYSGGVTFSYKISKRFTVQSGLFYSSVGQDLGGIRSFGGFKKFDNTKGDRNFEVMTTNGTVYTNNADVFLIADGPGERIATNFTNDVFDPSKANLQYLSNNLLQNFSYLELPIMLRYKFIDKMIDFNLVGGISYNMLVNNSVYTMVDGSKYFVGKTEGLNMITLSSSLGMAMEYSFSDNLSLNLEPTFRYYLNPFSRLSDSGIHPYSFGVFSGISYKF